MCDSCKSTHSDGGPLIGLGPWARSKLHYLDYYADLFSTGMQYHWPSRAYLDLFSGPGMCSIRGTREVVAGSPLVALRQKTPFTHYAFIDSDKSHVEALQDRSEVVATASHKTILHGDCNDLQVLRAALKGIPSDALRLAFIDPFRFNIKFETLRALAAGRRIDFIIVFQIAALKRSLESGSRLIDDFFGDAGAWREIYATNTRPKTHSGAARPLSRAVVDAWLPGRPLSNRGTCAEQPERSSVLPGLRQQASTREGILAEGNPEDGDRHVETAWLLASSPPPAYCASGS